MKVTTQTLYIAGAVILLAVLYFGFDTMPKSQKAVEKSRALTTKAFDIPTLVKETKPTLTPDQQSYFETLEAQLHHVTSDSQKIQLQKELSGFWFQAKQPLLAGLYAVQIAEKENTAQAWSIAGTTFAAALQKKEDGEQKTAFARDEAVNAFENAISLEPASVDHRINQALCYVEAPVAETPMKGIQMLAGLVEQYPTSPLPPYHLARMAVRTGQYERAAERIQQAMELKPDEPRFACLAIDIYTALGQPDVAKSFAVVCNGQ